MNQFLFIIFYLLSRSPVFSTTLDSNFDNITVKNFNIINLRYSLISLGIGIKKIYFFTWKKGEKFKFIKILKFEDIIKLPDNDEISNKVLSYRQQMSNKEEKDINSEIDFLKYKIEDNEETKNLSCSKMNNYTAIILVIIPLILTNLCNNVISNYGFRMKVIAWSILIYNLINIIIYLLDFYKVKRFSRSSFKDLKESNNHLFKLAESYYEDWYSIKKEAPLFVSYVLNVERYLKYITLFLVMFLSLNGILGIYKSNYAQTLKYNKFENLSYNIRISNNGQVYKEDIYKLPTVYDKISKNNIGQIIILTNLSNDESINKQYNSILDSIKMFNIKNSKITSIKDNNTDKKDNYIKILIIGGGK